MSTSETEASRVAEEEARRYAARDYDDREPQDLERDIDRTRSQVRADLEALERRLSFDRLMDLTVGRIRERGGEFAGNLTNAATQNPIPLLLTSVGVAWMMLTTRYGGNGRDYRSSAESLSSSAEHLSSGLRSRASNAAQSMADAKEELGERLHGAAESSRQTWDRAAEASRETWERTAGSLRDSAGRAREELDHARERMDRLVHEQPLMLGALGLAAGALIGAFLPETEAENRMLGETRDRALGNVARASRKRYEAAREQAQAFSAPESETSERPSRPH